MFYAYDYGDDDDSSPEALEWNEYDDEFDRQYQYRQYRAQQQQNLEPGRRRRLRAEQLEHQRRTEQFKREPAPLGETETGTALRYIRENDRIVEYLLRGYKRRHPQEFANSFHMNSLFIYFF